MGKKHVFAVQHLAWVTTAERYTSVEAAYRAAAAGVDGKLGRSARVILIGDDDATAIAKHRAKKARATR
jgi:hypothetical protein